MTLHQIESLVRKRFNEVNGRSAQSRRLVFGKCEREHEFDLCEPGKVIGGISSSPWCNNSGTANTAGRDRAVAELLWLSLWGGSEKRVHILTNREMAKGLFDRFQGVGFPHSIEILYFSMKTKRFTSVGSLQAKRCRTLKK